MRPWLVVVGIVFLTLGIGSATTLYLGDQGSVSSTNGTGPISFPLGSNSSEVLTLQGTNGTTEHFRLQWAASSAIAVELESSAGCSSGGSTCWPSAVLAQWSGSASGVWAGAGPFHYPLLCVLKNSNADPSAVTVSGRASAETPVHETLVVSLLLGLSAAALFIVGGLAVFLGLFLASDPYGPAAPPVSRSAEDVEEILEDPRAPH